MSEKLKGWIKGSTQVKPEDAAKGRNCKRLKSKDYMFEWTEENNTEMMKLVEDIKMGYYFTGDRPVVMMFDASPWADEGASNTQDPIDRYRQAVPSIFLSKV